MNRRSFLHTAGLSGAGLVATATLAEAGALAEFFDWLRRRPSFSFPSRTSSRTLWDPPFIRAEYMRRIDHMIMNGEGLFPLDRSILCGRALAEVKLRA